MISNVTLETAPPVSAPSGMPPMVAMLQLLSGKHITYSLSALARLGVADYLSYQPTPVGEIAEKVGAHAPSLYRVMRFLAGIGVFEERPGKQFTLTPLAEVLQTNAPSSLRYLAMAWGDQWGTRAMEHFTDCVRTGQDGITQAFGKHAFAFFAEHPEQAEVFHLAMGNLSAQVGNAVADAYDFSQMGKVADIGGGHGMLLATILHKNDNTKGVLFDLPEVIAGAMEKEHFAGITHRVQTEAGSFFEQIPSGCDAYLLKNILHDWDDERCRQILNLIREQLPPNGRVLICELTIPEEAGPSPAKAIDIEMLLMTPGGKERTVAEFSELLRSAGLRLAQVVPTQSPAVLLEAQRA